MPDQKKKPDQADKNKNSPTAPAKDDCQSNTGQPSKGPRKPECPDGYPNEQPPSKPEK